MTEFYDYTDSQYYKMLKDSVRVYCWKLELLDYQDAVIKEIVVDLDTSNSGSLNFGNQQGLCRTCSFTFINLDNSYSIIENNAFWDRRRFKIYIGIKNNERVYWFSKGVYITQSADIDYHSVTIQAVDKYGLLDGTLQVLPAFLKTTFLAGTKIGDIVRQILLQDIGNGFVLDAVEPIIDPDIAKMLLYKDYEMAVGSYYGDFLSELMNSYGCDIYYDAMGRLRVERKFNDDLPYWYFYQGVTYTFSDEDVHYQEPNSSYEFDGSNYITVETDDTDAANASYSLANHNPQSPVCIEKIGYRAYDDGRPVYISAGDTSVDAPERKCKEYAEYMLLKETCNTVTKSFNAPIIPHLDARQTIRISDKTTLDDGVVYLITSLSVPFGVAEDCSITATNIQWLLTDVESTSLTSEKGSPASQKYTVSFTGVVKDESGQDLSFDSVTDFVGSAILLPSSGRARGNAQSDLGYFNGTNVFAGWQDNMYGVVHYSGSLYTIPSQNAQMSPEWVAGQVGVVKCNISTAGTYKVKAIEASDTIMPIELIYLKTDNKYIAPDENMKTTGADVDIANAGAYEIDYVFAPNQGFYLSGFDSSSIFSEATEIDFSSLTYVYDIRADMAYGLSKLQTFVFPPNTRHITGTNTLADAVHLNSITFPTAQCVITDPQDFMSGAGALATPSSELVIPSNIVFDYTGISSEGFLSGCVMAKIITLNCVIQSDDYYPYYKVDGTIEEINLMGCLHFSSIIIYNGAKKVVISSNVTIDNWGNFGTGAAWHTSIANAQLQTINNWFSGYSGSYISLDMPNLTTISNCFLGMGNSLTSFDIPANVTTITGSFNGSSGLSALTFTKVTSVIGSFSSMVALQTVSFGSYIIAIQQSFNGNNSMGNIVLGQYQNNNSIETIISSFNASGSALVVIPNSIHSIEQSFCGMSNLETFGGVSGTNPYVGGSITDSFLNCPSLTDVYFPSNISIIERSFNSCGIATLNIPNSVTTIRYSFTYNPLTTIYIGTGLTSVEDFLNPSFTDLETITVDSNNANLSSENNCVYNANKTILYFSALSGITSLTVNSATTRLSLYAIYMNSLTTLTLPASLTTIDTNSINPNISIGTLEILNNVLDMTNIPYSGISKIRGYAGSTAETFAQTYNIPFETIV